jgi:DNA-binding response OmpR family regulator
MSYHILIVDDDPLMRNLMRDILIEERAGDQVETAASGWEALRMMNQGSVDILIADWQMPDMSGIRLIELAQALYPATHVVLVTPVDQREVQERRRGRKISFTSFTKPFSIDAFLAHIASLLTEKSGPTTEPELARRRGLDEGRANSRFSPVLGLA